MAVSYAAKRTLRPGETLETFRTFVTVHHGRLLRRSPRIPQDHDRPGSSFPEVPTPGLRADLVRLGLSPRFKPEQIYGALPIVTKLGFGWVTLDDGWQTAEGDWYVNPRNFPAAMPT